MIHLWLALLLTLTPNTGEQSESDEVPLPVEMHYLLLAKALSFDRALARFGDEIVIAVVYQEQYPASRRVAATFTRSAASSPARSINGVPVRVVRVALEEGVDVSPRLREKGADLLYLAPVRAVKASSVVAAARSMGAATTTGVPGYLGSGVALAIGRKGERGHLLVAIERARAEGSNYSAQLLSWAEVVQ